MSTDSQILLRDFPNWQAQLHELRASDPLFAERVATYEAQAQLLEQAQGRDAFTQAALTERHAALRLLIRDQLKPVCGGCCGKCAG